jgi:protein-disulfide isomerase
MHLRLATVALGTVLLLDAGCQGSDSASRPAPSAEDSPVAAEVNGRSITVAELDAYIKDQLFESRTQGGDPSKLHELRTQSLDRLIAEQVLETEATRRGVEVEEVIELEVAELGPVTDEEVQEFFDANKAQLGGRSLEDMAPQIKQFLEGRRRSEVPSRLRERASVTVHMEAPRFEVAAEGPAKGPADAPVTIVEFSDFQCPYCQRSAGTVEQILEKYPDQVRVVYRHLPLERIHSRARAAAEAAACADDQEQFWPYHDKLFANNRALERDDLIRYAGELGRDEEAFSQCFDDGRFRDKVNADLAAAQKIGITGTPAFVVNGVLLSGARPAEDFYRVIEAELERLGTTGSS